MKTTTQEALKTITDKLDALTSEDASELAYWTDQLAAWNAAYEAANDGTWYQV